MKFSLDFIKEFIDLDDSSQSIASRLTMAGMEIGDFEQAGGDWIFDAEITTNRYDWLSMIGIAKELAALLGKKAEIKIPRLIKEPALKEIDIIIENKNDCPVYLVRLIKGVKVEESPSWLKQRLVNCGLNAVNNLVDSTNYCMLKWGNPLHAFDFDKIEGNIYVRRAKKGEKFLGLDDKERSLNKNNLVIADEKKVIALAGIMGAKNAEVDENTKNVLLEAAVFSPLAIRCSRRDAVLETESSYRFERKVFFDYLELASAEAADKIISLSKGKFCGYKSKGESVCRERIKISFSLSKLNDYLGIIIPESEVKTILENLEFTITKASQEGIEVEPPSFRMDIQREVDVYEEVVRVYGYEKIPLVLPFIAVEASRGIYEFKKSLRNFLVGLGLKEVITYSITGEKFLEKLNEENVIKIVNPLRQQENALRSTLLPGAIDVVRYNLNQKSGCLRLFEIADIYKKGKDSQGESFREIFSLSLIITDKENRIFYLKGIVEEILKFANVENYAFKEKGQINFTNALEILNNDTVLGFLGRLDKDKKEGFDLKEDLYFTQINLEALCRQKKDKIFVPFSRFPFISRDISMAIEKKKKFLDIEATIKKEAQPYFKKIEILDTYEGKNVPAGFYFLTLRIYYQAGNKTLTSQEVDAVHNKIRDILTKIEGITLR
ncbi:MAG: phenylalanine--tRNA ligase subunit beta [Candidatus Omnitrophica bacterium]|nr:phenylalanine--tRNA ligase subunit beta [Candidatus Omnitrophota bacterium]